MTIPQQAIEAVKRRWTWKPIHWEPLPSDEAITAILTAALPAHEAELRQKIEAEIGANMDSQDVQVRGWLDATQSLAN